MPWVMRYRISRVTTKRSKIYVHAAMVVTRDPGHVSRSDFVCNRSCRVHMIGCARNPSSRSALRHDILQLCIINKKVEIYDDAPVVVTHALKHVLRSDFVCSWSCRVHIIECARIWALNVRCVMRCCNCVLTSKKGRNLR